MKCPSCHKNDISEDGELCHFCIFEEGWKAGEAVGILKGRKEVGQLAIQILNFAEHGDYSNGNESQGSDEGRYLAGLAIADFRKQLKEWRIEA